MANKAVKKVGLKPRNRKGEKYNLPLGMKAHTISSKTYIPPEDIADGFGDDDALTGKY